MINYNISYVSENQYEVPVSEAFFEFLVLPCNDSTQKSTLSSLRDSLGDDFHVSKNAFGFDVIRVRAHKNFQKYEFSISSKVEKNDDVPLVRGSVLPKKQEFEMLKSLPFIIDNAIFLRNTPLTTLSEESLSKTPQYDGKKSVYSYLLELNDYVFMKLVYTPFVTNTDTTAEEAFQLEMGVGQDFAHLFIAIARANGIPARYVSGYTNRVNTYKVIPAMDAWVEALIPGAGWAGFDPTNNRLVDENYIKVAHGTDYSDCTPLKGLLRTQGKGFHHTFCSVDVKQIK
ncbi:MAG: transglutaminase family protein [Cytophagales bacterium]|nr:transglutaminase family protein [Cytophagales bacterium]MDW8385295.1 transglutaminase family protein [Flammeovirgaceae bacterium]